MNLINGDKLRLWVDAEIERNTRRLSDMKRERDTDMCAWYEAKIHALKGVLETIDADWLKP